MEDIRSYRFNDDETVRILKNDDDTVRINRRDVRANEKDDVEVPFEIPRD